MNCEEFKTLAASYALGALEGDERERAQAHLQEAHHTGCLDALRVAEDGLAHLAKALVPVRPRPELWLEIDHVVDKRAGRGGGARRVSRAAWLVAAAALVFGLIEWSAARSLKREITSLQTLIATSAATEQRARLGCLHTLAETGAQVEMQKRALRTLQEPGSVVMALAPKGDAPVAHAVWSAATKSAFVMASGMRSPEGKDYALWVLRGQQKLAAGLLKPDAQGLALAEVDRKLLDGPVDAFLVTLEPSGGGEVPTGPVLNAGSPKKG